MGREIRFSTFISFEVINYQYEKWLIIYTYVDMWKNDWTLQVDN